MVRLKGWGDDKNAWGGIFFILSVFLFFFILMLYNFLPLAAARWGVSAPARLVDKQKGETHFIKYPRVWVEFPVGNQMETSEIDTISWAFYDQAHIGDRVDVRYLPAFTSKPSLDQDPPSLLLLLEILMTFYFPWLLYRWFTQDKRLLMNGFLVEGVVSEVSKWRDEAAWVVFEWKGKTYRRASILKSYGTKNRPGDRMLILVNPLKPLDNMIFDDAECTWRVLTSQEDFRS